MVCELTAEDLAEAFAFSYPISLNSETNSYPIYPTAEDLKNAMIGTFQDPHDKLIGCFDKEELIGVCMLFPIEQDRFLQTNGFYTKKENFERTADEIVRYLKLKFPGYRALFGFPRENQYAGMYFYEHGGTLIESSYTLLCDRYRFRENAHKPAGLKCVRRLEPERFLEYAPFHDTYAGEIYWCSERIARNLTPWWIYTYEEEGEIIGSLFMHVENDIDAEIFGVFVKEGYSVKKICQALLYQTVSELFPKLSNVRDVIYFVEENSHEELQAAIETGFMKTDHYRCYEMKL